MRGTHIGYRRELGRMLLWREVSLAVDFLGGFVWDIPPMERDSWLFALEIWIDYDNYVV